MTFEEYVADMITPVAKVACKCCGLSWYDYGQGLDLALALELARNHPDAPQDVTGAVSTIARKVFSPNGPKSTPVEFKSLSAMYPLGR
jgi:hypothetical protein